MSAYSYLFKLQVKCVTCGISCSYNNASLAGCIRMAKDKGWKNRMDPRITQCFNYYVRESIDMLKTVPDWDREWHEERRKTNESREHDK